MPKNSSKTSTKLTIEWSVLRNALLILSLTIVVGVIIIVGSQYYHDQMEDWELKQRRDFGAVNAEYQQLQKALGIVVNNSDLKRFRRFKKEGFFTNNSEVTIDDKRLKMRDEFREFLFELKKLKQLFDAQFTLLEKKQYVVPLQNIEPQFKTYETQITLKLELLHEEDVLKLIERIEFQRYAGLFNWQSCNIKRRSNQINLHDVSKPYFDANCVLNWYISKVENN